MGNFNRTGRKVLEKEIADLKTDNDTTLKRVNTSINLNEIKEKAIAELGMVYAAPDQVCLLYTSRCV